MTATIADYCRCYSLGDGVLTRNPACPLHGDEPPEHDDPTPHLLAPNGRRTILAGHMPNGERE